MKPEIKIGLTMGDPNGIGAEVLIRALQFMHPFQDWNPYIFGDYEILTKMNKILDAPFSFFSISENHGTQTKEVIDSLDQQSKLEADTHNSFERFVADYFDK